MSVIRLPFGETDPAKRYSFPDPDSEKLHDAAHAARYAPETLTKGQAMWLAEIASAYFSLTTYELGQEHCVAKLRDIWRARRAVKSARGGEAK